MRVIAADAAQSAAQRRPGASLQLNSWPTYFKEDFDAQDRRALLVNELAGHLGGDAAGWALLSRLQPPKAGTHVLPCDYEQLLRCCQGSADLAAALELQPAEALACLAAAAHEVLYARHAQRAASELHARPGARVLVRLSNYSPSLLHIRQLKSSCIGKLATIRGTVVRMGPIRPLIVAMDFGCAKCGATQHVALSDGKYEPPTRCSDGGCRGRTFHPDRSGARCVDWQRVRLQELLGADQQQQGRVPKTVEVEMREDLVGSCSVGEVVSVLGMVKVLAAGAPPGAARPPKGPKGQPAAQQLFLIYLDALSVTGAKRAAAAAAAAAADPAAADGGGDGCGGGCGSAAAAGGGGDTVAARAGRELAAAAPAMPALTVRDLQFVLTFTREYEGRQLRQLVAALCPGIYGLELVKAALVLALFGGVPKNVGAPDRVPIRGDVHVLLVGDPGLGKSQLLQAVATAAPRGLYVCGNTSTGAGMTVSVVKDAVTGDFMFEAGAVVLADRGVCCVDEFDKMNGEHQALLEAMEQQEVSVAKAGLVASLPARTAIIAAANPIGGRYDRGKTVGENLRMSPAMLSRFDLSFILLDRPDESLDQALSEHVMAIHSGITERATAARQRLFDSRRAGVGAAADVDAAASGVAGAMPSSQRGCSGGDGGGRATLAARLRMSADEADAAPLPVQLLRKYIAYARTYVRPVLGEEAKAVLQAFYLQLRAQAAPGDGSPVTARQLESLVRLAEARARLELREQVTREDAEDVIEVMREALFDRCGGGGGATALLPTIDFRRAPGTRGGNASEAARFLAAARRLGQQEGRDLFSRAELLALAHELQLSVADPTVMLERLNDAGELLNKGAGVYRVTGVCLQPSGVSQAQSYC